MEIKINKEIRGYTESVFFGLSARQFIFTVLGIVSAAAIYFAFRGALGNEGVSWICMLSAAPFIFFGFFSYNGMNAEKFLFAYIKCRFLEKRKLPFECGTAYHKTKKESGKAGRKDTK